MAWSGSSIERSLSLLGAAAYRLTLDTGGWRLFSGQHTPAGIDNGWGDSAPHSFEENASILSGLNGAEITGLPDGLDRMFLAPQTGLSLSNMASAKPSVSPCADLEKLAGQTRVIELDWLPGSEGLLGRAPGDPIRPEDMPELLGDVYPAWLYQARKVMEQGGDYAWTHSLKRSGKQGEPGGPLSVSHHIVYDGPGRVIGALKAARPGEGLEQEARLQLDVLEKLPVGVLFIDTGFRVRWTNQLADRQGSFNWKNHYGERCHELHFGCESPCRGCPTARCLREGESCSGEISTPGGKTRLITAMPVYGKDGERIGAVQITTDVSEIAEERRQVLDSLRQRETRLSRFQEVLERLHAIPALNGGSFSNGAKAILKVATGSLELDFCRLWLRKEQGFGGVAVYNNRGRVRRLGAVAARALDEYEPLLRSERKLDLKINGNGGPDERHSRLPKLEEAYRKIGVKTALLCPIKFGGELLGLISMEHTNPHDWHLEEQNFALALADFAALQVVHDHLRDSRRKLDSLLANLPGAAFRIKCSKEKFSLEFVSRGCAELIGYLPSEMLKPGFDVRSIIHPEDLGYYEAAHLSTDPEAELREEFSYGGLWQHGRELIFRCTGKEGRVRWLWVRLRSVFSEKDGALVHEGFAHDITDRYKLREMEAADKAKGEFLAKVSHEIRTPMNAILGMTRMALKTELNPKQCDYIHKIQAAAGTLLGIINDILDVSGIESGKLSLENAPFRVDGVMSGLSSLFGPRGREKGVGFRLHVGKDVPYELIGDYARLSKILSVLLDNAFKFTDQGEVSVDCRLDEELSANAVRLRFVVEDSGIGMREEEREELFQAFSQGDGSRSRKYGGAGLGLALASKLVEMMNGDLAVKSACGRGTRVSFTCVLERSGLGDPVVRSLGRRGEALAALERPPRVLVYGPNRRELANLVDLLSDYNVEITEAARRQELLLRLREMSDQGEPCRLLVLSHDAGNGKDGRDPELEKLLRSVKSPLMSAAPGVLMLAPYDMRLEDCSGSDCVDAFLLRPVIRSLFIRSALDLLGAGEPEEQVGTDPTKRPERANGGSGGCEMDGPASFVFRGEEILLVEDNLINQEIAMDLLSETGLKVSLAANGLEALRVIKERDAEGAGRRFALILMDLQMPEMDGFAATRAIRALPEYGRVPILAMTAHAFEEERERCRLAGMNGHVSKPVDAFVLYRMLHDNLYGRAAH